MPSIPPFSRSEKISDYASQCRGVVWHEERIRASDGVELGVAVGSVSSNRDGAPQERGRQVVILYFQGNGGSIPPRLPNLSTILKSLSTSSSARYAIHALSYRGYWKSRGRPSQPGIELDASTLLDEISAIYPPDVSIVLWGQSLGASVAVHAATAATAKGTDDGKKVGVEAIILETPLVSIKRMLETVYPQRWLPYRYLSPFLWNHWDTASALRRLATSGQETPSTRGPELPKILILQAGNDELVPQEHGEELVGVCKEVGVKVERVAVGGALHAGCMGRRQGQEAVVRMLREVSKEVRTEKQ